MITAAQLKTRFPGAFDAIADATVNLCIDEAAAVILEATWGADYDTGLLYLSAHLLERTIPKPGSPLGPASVSGQLKSWTADGLSVTFAEAALATTTTVSDSEFMSTAYGQRFLSLRRIRQHGPRVPHDFFS